MLPVLSADQAGRVLAGTCAVCGAPLPPDKRGSRVYCGPECSRIAARGRAAQRRQARATGDQVEPSQVDQVEPPQEPAELARQADELRARALELRREGMALLASAGRLERSAEQLAAAAVGQLDLFHGPGQLLRRDQVVHPAHRSSP